MSSVATTARWRLSHAIPLTQALRVGERLREATLGCAARVYGRNAIPWVLSGHGILWSLSHRHAFYLAEDMDQDGGIDHVVIHAEAGLEPLALASLGQLGFIFGAELCDMWAGEGGTVHASGSLFGHAEWWVSVTPYLPPWHTNKHSQAVDQLRRECRLRGLPDLTRIEELPGAILPCGIIPVAAFDRRRASGAAAPYLPGWFFAIKFERAPCRPGPIALGYGCHFGLGLFRPVEPE